jgi:hypothetical protein
MLVWRTPHRWRTLTDGGAFGHCGHRVTVGPRMEGVQGEEAADSNHCGEIPAFPIDRVKKFGNRTLAPAESFPIRGSIATMQVKSSSSRIRLIL